MRMNSRNGSSSGVVRAALMCAMLALTAQLQATVTAPSRPLTVEQITTSLGFVEKLINNSSVARDIEASNFAPAIAYLNGARRVYERAQQELTAGKLAESASHRDEAIHLMMEAGHLARLALAPDNKPEADYHKRLGSIEALRDAHRRAAAEKGNRKADAELAAAIAPQLAAAEQHAKEGHHSEALAEANLAYATVKHALNEIRGGETLGQLSSEQVDTLARPAEEYESRLRSVNALLDAYQRIASEKSQAKASKALQEQTTMLLGKASRAAAGRDYQTANDSLKVAYAQVRDALEKLRGGETLVRSLNFATPEEEYHYELDRNDTYRMLIQMLIEEKKTMGVDARVQRFLDQATAQRALAERQASEGEFAPAIKTMEDSTRSLIQAMRNAGIFIPG